MDLWASDEFIFTKTPKGIRVTRKCQDESFTNAHIVSTKSISSIINYWEVKINKIQSRNKGRFLFGVNPSTNSTYYYSSTLSINGTGGNFNVDYSKGQIGKPFEDNEVFGLYYDDLLKKLTFYRNGIFYCEAKLNSKSFHYPIFFLESNDESLEINCPKIPTYIRIE